MDGSTSFRRACADGEEERLLDRAIAYLTKATGKRPVGYRAPSWAFSGVTLDLIRKKGFLYDSSLQALDEPYEILSRGRGHRVGGTGHRLDAYRDALSGPERHMPSPELLYQLYKDEFDGAYARRHDVHPDVASLFKRPSRADASTWTLCGLHEVQARRLVRHLRAGSAIRNRWQVSAPSARRQAGRPVVLRHEQHRGLPERGLLSRGIEHRNLAVILARRQLALVTSRTSAARSSDLLLTPFGHRQRRAFRRPWSARGRR